MEMNSIDLLTSSISSVDKENNAVRINFQPANIVRTMTGALEKSLWYQNGSLVIEEASVTSEPSELPAACDGGDIVENIYTYRDMIPIPLDSRGQVSCKIKFKDSDNELAVEGEVIRLEMIDTPKYIKHTKD